MQFTVTVPSISKVVRSIPSAIVHLTQFALPATIALGFFVSWIAFGAYTLLLLLPFFLAQKPDLDGSSLSLHRNHAVFLLGAGIVVIVATQFLPTDYLQGFMQSMAKLRSVRSPMAESVATGNAADAIVFIGEALSGVLLAFIVFRHMAHPNQFFDTCSLDLRSQTKRTALGWLRWCCLWVVVSFVMFWINFSISNDGIPGWLLSVKAAMMPAIGYIFLVNAVGAIRALPLIFPDVDPK